MLTRILDWVAGKEPVATATGIAAVITAALGVGAAFGLPVTPEQIAAIGALAAALAGWAGRKAVSPVQSPADRKIGRLLSRPADPLDTIDGDSRIDRGSIPLALLILIGVGVALIAGIAVSCDALFEDETERNDIGLVASHDYCAADHDYCGGPGGYEDERGGKQTCFMACYIVVPSPFDPGGGGREPREPRTTNA